MCLMIIYLISAHIVRILNISIVFNRRNRRHDSWNINLISKEILVIWIVKSGLSSCEFLVDLHNVVQIFIIIVLKRHELRNKIINILLDMVHNMCWYRDVRLDRQHAHHDRDVHYEEFLEQFVCNNYQCLI